MIDNDTAMLPHKTSIMNKDNQRVKEATEFFQQKLKEQSPFISPLKSTTDKKAILLDKEDKLNYKWGKEG